MAAQRWGSAVLSFDAVEEVCESRQTTLVIHPASRRSIKGYEESFYVGLRCFLAGETDGLYFLPLQSGGYVRLIFSKRVSSGGHNVLRIDPLRKEGLAQIMRPAAAVEDDQGPPGRADLDTRGIAAIAQGRRAGLWQ